MMSLEAGHYEIALSPQRPHKVSTHRETPVARPLARRSERLLAAIFDQFAYAIPTVSGFLAVRDMAYTDASGLRLRIWISGWLVVFLCQVYLLSTRGQTLGKLAVGVRIVDQDDESNSGFVRAWLLRSLVPWLITFFPLLGQLFWLADLVAIFGEERRCLHDGIAGTKVVSV
jgi:uncharacterized RDD family membrane protein YckC